MGKRLAAALLLLGMGVAPAFGGMNLGGPTTTGIGGNGGTGGGGGFGWAPDDFTLALRAMHRSDYDTAIPYLENALRKRPQSAEIMNDLGLSNRMVGKYHASHDWLEKALALDPDHRKAHENLGELGLAMNDSAAAQAQLNELVRLCPDSCDERDMLTRAIADYQAAHPATPAATTQTGSR